MTKIKMALVMNTYNIILIVAIIIFIIGILLLSYKLLVVPDTSTQLEKLIGLEEIMMAGQSQKEMVGSAKGSVQGSQRFKTAEQDSGSKEVMVGGAHIPPTELSSSKKGKSKKINSKRQRQA